MVENMIDLTENYLIVQTINRYFPIETHTKIPLIHFYQIIFIEQYTGLSDLNITHLRKI